MTSVALGIGAVLMVAAGGLLLFRIREERRVEALAASLEEGGSHGRFDPAMVEDVPEPGRRYLLHALEPGAPLATSVRLEISGSIRMSPGGEPMPMESEEVLAAGRGYVWTARMKKGALTIRGFDSYAHGEAEMRWWVAGLVPVVREAGEDLSRSGAGRLAGESALFLPSVLLPSRGASWERMDDSTALVRFDVEGVTTEFTLEVEPDGSLRRLSYERWNADPENGPVGHLPFVIDEFGEERTFDGHTIPTRFRAGWRLGGEDEFPFFFPRVAGAEYR